MLEVGDPCSKGLTGNLQSCKMGTVLDVIFFQDSPPFFCSWWKGEEETYSYRAGLWNVRQKPLAALHFPEANINCQDDNHNAGNSTLKTSTAAPKPRSGTEAQSGSPCSSSPAPRPGGSGPVCVGLPPGTPPLATASTKAEATSVTPASRLGSGSALEVALLQRCLRAAEGRDTASWAAGSSPPRWESQPRRILLPCSACRSSLGLLETKFFPLKI